MKSPVTQLKAAKPEGFAPVLFKVLNTPGHRVGAPQET